MIINHWTPHTKLINGKQVKVLYTKAEKLNSNTLTVWVCDNPKCKNPHLKHTIRYSYLRDNVSDTCNLNVQLCKSCQTMGHLNPMYGKTHTNDVKSFLRKNIIKSYETIKEKYGVNNISELDIIKEKKGQIVINFNTLSEIVAKEGYKLLELDGNNKYAMLKIVCPNDHIFFMRYERWKRGHRCVECFYDRLRQNGIRDKEGFLKYKILVLNETKKSLKKFYKHINPLNLSRRRNKYHLDHKYSIVEGFKNNIDPKIIGSKFNLTMISEHDNCSKQDKCSITKEELISEYLRKD
jgi:hypothetical protein